MPREMPAIRLICSFKIRLESYSLIFFLAIFDGTKTPLPTKKTKTFWNQKTQKRTPGKKQKRVLNEVQGSTYIPKRWHRKTCRSGCKPKASVTKCEDTDAKNHTRLKKSSPYEVKVNLDSQNPGRKKERSLSPDPDPLQNDALKKLRATERTQAQKRDIAMTDEERGAEEERIRCDNQRT